MGSLLQRTRWRALRSWAGALALLGALCHPLQSHAQLRSASDWGYYGGDGFGRRFSSLDQINRTNVSQLVVAWTYRTGERGAGFARAGKLTFEATPVLAFGLLYLETGTNILIALDPQTGTQRWRFDPHVDRAHAYAEASSRGVGVWEEPNPRPPGPCRHRIFTGTLDARLLAVDAETGLPCADFGDGGQLDLTRGVRIRDPGAYLVTSPPTVYGNLVIGLGDRGQPRHERRARHHPRLRGAHRVASVGF